MRKYDYLIVGGGLFGATFAALAKRAGKSVLLVEKRPHLAGNAYTEHIDGITVHRYGAHIFHTSNERVWKFLNEFSEFHDFINTPIANYKGEYYHLPFNMNTFYELWGVTDAESAKKILDAQTKKYGKDDPATLKDAALGRVGEDIYKKLIEGYTEKQWGRKCDELPAFIIGRLPLRFTFDNNYYNDRFQGIPVGGYTEMVSKMTDDVEVLLGVDYFDFIKGHEGIANKTVYTGSIDRFFDYRFGALEYRSLRFENETLDREQFQSVAVVNYTDAETPFTRIIEHKHFLDEKSDRTVITREYPESWTTGGEAFYPINDDKNDALYEKYRAEARSVPDVIFGGRLGEYKYYDMDATVLRAMELADREFGN